MFLIFSMILSQSLWSICLELRLNAEMFWVITKWLQLKNNSKYSFMLFYAFKMAVAIVFLRENAVEWF